MSSQGYHKTKVRHLYISLHFVRKLTVSPSRFVHHNPNEIYNSNINKLPAATHCFQYHFLSLQSRGTILLARYFLHVSSAPHQKHLISSTQSPQDVLLCGQVKAGVVVGETVVHVPLLFAVTGAAVVAGDELFKLVEEDDVLVVVVELMPETKQIQKTNESTMFFMLTGLRC